MMKRADRKKRQRAQQQGFALLDTILTIVVVAVVAFGAITIIAGKMEDPEAMTVEEAEQIVDRYLGGEAPHPAISSDDGPIAFWAFDEGSGQIATDSSGNGHTGTLTNMQSEESWVKVTPPGSPVEAFALDFDGRDDVVTVPDAPDLQNLGALTISAWIFPVSERPSYLISKRDTCDGPWRFALENPEGMLGFFKQTDDSALQIRSAPHVLTLNEWNHIALTWDGTLRAEEGASIRVNGEEVSYALKQDGAGNLPSDKGCDLRIGARAGPEEVFDGLMDDIRIYDRVLPAEEIRTLAMGMSNARASGEETAQRSASSRSAGAPEDGSGRPAAGEQEEEESVAEGQTATIPLRASVVEGGRKEEAPFPDSTPTIVNITIRLEIEDGKVTGVTVD